MMPKALRMNAAPNLSSQRSAPVFTPRAASVLRGTVVGMHPSDKVACASGTCPSPTAERRIAACGSMTKKRYGYMAQNEATHGHHSVGWNTASRPGWFVINLDDHFQEGHSFLLATVVHELCSQLLEHALSPLAG